MAEQEKPRLRKPLGVLLLIVFLALYAAFVVVVTEPVQRLPALAQAPAWLLLGIAWVPLALPLVRWIETGRFRR